MPMPNFNVQQLTNSYLQAFSQAFHDCPQTSDGYYSITPVKSTSLRQALLEAIDILKRMTVALVPHPIGQVVTVAESTLRTGRVKDGRFYKGSGIDDNTFSLCETDSNCVITWEQLAWWGNSGSANQFFNLMNSTAVYNFAADMLRIGFNGTSRAEESTDSAKNPLGEDVNIGWHQLVKNWAEQSSKNRDRIITDAVRIGKGGDYLSLDAAGSDLVRLLPSQYQSDPSLVFLVGADLVAAEEVRLYNAEDRPSENIAAQKLSQNIAGRPAIVPPFMPSKRMVVTKLSNLQILTLMGSQRRKAEDNGDRKRFENSYWRYEGYALGDPECYAALDESAAQIVGDPEPRKIPDISLKDDAEQLQKEKDTKKAIVPKEQKSGDLL